MSTARLILVRFGALFAYLGAHWSGGRAIDAWKLALSSDPSAKVGLLDLVGSTCAALISAAACGWFLLGAWRGYRAHREGRFAHERDVFADAIQARAREQRAESYAAAGRRESR